MSTSSVSEHVNGPKMNGPKKENTTKYERRGEIIPKMAVILVLTRAGTPR